MNTGHTTKAGANIFADLEVPEAINERLRLKLLAEIRIWYNSSGLNQTEAAEQLGIKQPTLNNVIKGQYEKFTIDRLVKMLSAIGKQITLTVSDTEAA